MLLTRQRHDDVTSVLQVYWTIKWRNEMEIILKLALKLNKMVIFMCTQDFLLNFEQGLLK